MSPGENIIKPSGEVQATQRGTKCPPALILESEADRLLPLLCFLLL